MSRHATLAPGIARARDDRQSASGRRPDFPDLLPSESDARRLPGVEFGLWAVVPGKGEVFLGPVYTYSGVGGGSSRPFPQAERDAWEILAEFAPDVPGLAVEMRRVKPGAALTKVAGRWERPEGMTAGAEGGGEGE